MSFKLALNAGHGMSTAGKRCMKALDPNETRENYLNRRICDKIENLLKNYNGVEVLRIDDPTGKTDIALKTRTDKANKWKADFYLAIHANAGINGGTGGGISAFVYTSVNNETLAWQKELYNELISLTGLKGNRATPLAKANLHEVRETNMPAVLLELGFMDSKTDVPIILTDKFATQCAQACVNVIVKRAKLSKKQTQTTTTTGKTYKVVTSINRYPTAADAKAQTNAKTDKLLAGTYYIYNKYPNGVNGMYNISVDSTGASAGSWINPSENVAPKQEESVQKLYRVRKTWADSKSQVGAFSSLLNAKDACQKAGSGYKVFDWNGKEVYAYTAPKVEPTPAPKPVTPTDDKKETTTTVTAVYDLNFPITKKIVDKGRDSSDTEVVQAIKYILSNNSSFDIEIAKAFYKLAPRYGIDPTWAISQSILETGWFKYQGSAVKPEHHNYCGLGVTSTGIEGGKFNTIEEGVTAQLQHLFAYGCKDTLPNNETVLDPRFKYVTRGIAPYWEQLAGRWAVPGYDKASYSTPEAAMKAENTYGQKIRKIANGLLATTVSDADIEKYFGKDEPQVEPDDGLDTDKINVVMALLEKVLRFFIKLFGIDKESDKNV